MLWRQNIAQTASTGGDVLRLPTHNRRSRLTASRACQPLTMAILSLSNAHLAYGHVALLDGAAFSLEAGERARR